jgi:hypothetical protein
MSYIGNTATQQAFTPAVDFFNGNGSTTAFTLSRPVASVAQVQAVIENVPQKPSDAFTVSGNTITFTSAPPSGTQNIYVYYTSPINQVIAPSQGTVGPTALTAGAPSWSQAGGVTLPRIDSTNEGGQINFNRASDDTQVWAIDSFGSTSTPTLRFINGATVAASLDGSNNLSFNSGYGSSAIAYGCRAWVNFNGTGTVAIRASGNVSSITDNGTGEYTVNFTTAMPDTNYSVSATARVVGDAGCVVPLPDSTNTTSAYRIASRATPQGASTDAAHVYFQVFR